MNHGHSSTNKKKIGASSHKGNSILGVGMAGSNTLGN
jgi:hypothetical protein